MKPNEANLVEGYFYWVKWQEKSQWEVCRYENGKFHFTDGGQCEKNSAFEIDFLPNKESHNNHFNWLRERYNETKTEYDAIPTDTPDNLKQKCGKGGKLRAFKEIIAFMQTH